MHRLFCRKQYPIFSKKRSGNRHELVCNFFTNQYLQFCEGISTVKKPNWIKYSPANHGNFQQQKPILKNTFLTDAPLQNYLNLRVPKEVSTEISRDLTIFGDRIVNEIDDLGWQCELNLPSLRSYDAWGTKISELTTCNAWGRQHDISAEEGLISIAYDRKLHHWSRLHQILKLYLYSPSSGLYSCPLAMTDGAARVLEVCSIKNDMFSKAYDNLISRDPKKFWVSGQWMTEKRGGSDVAKSTETIAVPEKDFHRLYGYKWFTSAADSHMALTLASIAEGGEPPKGPGLTMFYVETRRADGDLNNIQIVRLKNKLGTRQLPTGELLLDGAIAHKMSKEGQGISAISNMLNITRLHNSLASVAGMRRVLMLARDYSHKRKSFGKFLYEFPLHMRVLGQMELETRGCFMLLMKMSTLFGKAETNTATQDELLLMRLLLPIMKLYTAKSEFVAGCPNFESVGAGFLEQRIHALCRRSRKRLKRFYVGK